MSENILSKFNPLEDDFWGNDSEKKFRQIVNLGYASILASFIAGLMFFFKVGDFSGIIWDFLPFSYYSIWWYYRPPFYFSVFGIPIFNGLFLIYAFSNNKLTTFHKVFSCIFILSFLTDIPAYLFFMEFFDSLVFIGVLSEISYRVIIVILTVFVFFGKPSDLLPSMVKLLVLFSFISFLFSIIGGWLLFSESLEFSRLLGLLAVLFFSGSFLIHLFLLMFFLK